MYFDTIETGMRIKALRERDGMTQEELAGWLNVSYSQISRIERGKRAPSIDLLLDIADLFNVSIDYIFTGRHYQAANIRSALFQISQMLAEIAEEF